MIADVFINNFLYFFLIHVLNSHFLIREKSQPNSTQIPHKLTLLRIVVFVLLRVVAIFIVLYFFASLADGVAETPVIFFLYYVVVTKLGGHYQVETEVDDGVHDTFYGFY